MKIAVFDIGTNSIHLLIVEIRRDLSFKILEHEKDATRLGEGSFKNKFLSRSSIQRGLNTIARFHKIAKKNRVRRTLAVATSAVREAENGRKFIHLILKKTGIKVEVISGEEEARLIFIAAKSGIGFRHRKALVIDIGGGSVEMIVGDEKKVYLLESLKLGVARLTDRFITKDPASKKNVRSLVAHIEEKIKKVKKRIRKLKVSTVIGTAGTLLNLGTVIHEDIYSVPLGSVNGFKIRQKDVDRVAKKIVKSSWKERLRMRGLDPRRVDIAVAGAVLVQTLMRVLKIKSIVLSKKGIREGVILDFMVKSFNPPLHRKDRKRHVRI